METMREKLQAIGRRTLRTMQVALNWRNLIALCKDCHMKEHRKEKRWEVDENGNVTPKDPP